MAFPYEFLEELKFKNDIESVISGYVSLKRRGSTLVGLCPFHNEKTPSFTVYADKGHYHCYGCGAGGDVITFIRQIENLDYVEAVRFLAERAGISVPTDGVDDRRAKQRKNVLEINKISARFFYEMLISPGGEAAKNYYLSRKLEPKTIKHFGLGYAPAEWDGLLKHLRAAGFKDDDIVAANVASRGKNGGLYDRFRNRAMFPIIDLRGNVIGFSGRALPGDDKSAKYINTTDTPVYKKSNVLYGMNFAKNYCSEQMILVEGNVDVISLHQAGFQNTVAACGTAFTEEQARLISRYSPEIVVTLDADSAGQKATAKVLTLLDGLNISARVVRLPECKDPDEYIKKNGPVEFRKLLESAPTSVEYKLYMAADGIDLNADDGKINYLKKASESLAAIDDPITVDMYIGRLTKYGVSRQALETQIKKLRAEKRRRKTSGELREILKPKISRTDVNFEKQLKPRTVNAEETFLAVLATYPDLYNTARDLLSPDDMTTEFDRKFYRKLCEIYDGDYTFDISLLDESFTTGEVGYASAMVMTKGKTEQPERVLRDSADVIKSEKEKASLSKVTELNDEEWAENMRKIIDKRRNGAKK